jgi:hypothetical protein
MKSKPNRLLKPRGDPQLMFEFRHPSDCRRIGEEPQLPATAAEDGYSRQAVMIANVLLEGREHMGLDLGPEIEERLAKEAPESEEAAATPAISASSSARVK